MCSATMGETLAVFSQRHTGKSNRLRALHCDFNLSGADHSGLDGAAGASVLHWNLFAWNAIGHRFTGHAYADGSGSGGDDYVIALAHRLGQLHLVGSDHLVGLYRAGQLVAQYFIQSRYIALIEAGDIPLGSAHVTFAQHRVAQK